MIRMVQWGMLSGVVASVSAATLQEEFNTNPADRGWRFTGPTNLITWNAEAQRMDVTWDSSQPNSFCFLPLRTWLGTNDSFQLSFDLLLYDVQGGVNPAKPSTFPLGLGLTRMASALRTNFFRGLGALGGGPLNLVEFGYFPAAGYIFQPSITPVCVSSNGLWQPQQFTSLHPLTPGAVYQVTMTYDAAQARLTTEMTENGVPFPHPTGSIQTVSLATAFSDFRLDAFYIASYSDAFQAGPPAFHGSLLAHGWVDRVHLSFPDPPRPTISGHWSGDQWQVSSATEPGWTYWLERSHDCVTWTTITPAHPGTGDTVMFTDWNPPAPHALYRVASDRP